jgi:hypothetical protein
MLTTIRFLGHKVCRLRVDNDTVLLGAAFRNLLDVRLGIDGIVDILKAHFVVILGTFRIRGLRKRHEMR